MTVNTVKIGAVPAGAHVYVCDRRLTARPVGRLIEGVPMEGVSFSSQAVFPQATGVENDVIGQCANSPTEKRAGNGRDD
jgi:hypothetical protein